MKRSKKSKHDRKAVYFEGHRLADLRFTGAVCGQMSPRQWECTKVHGHRGKHVAHCTDDETNLPDQIMDVWS